MDVVSVVESVIKNHPLVDFNYEAGEHQVHWCLCPCGFSTRKYRTARGAQNDFKRHITEEVNEELVTRALLEIPSAAPVSARAHAESLMLVSS